MWYTLVSLKGETKENRMEHAVPFYVAQTIQIEDVFGVQHL